MAKTQQLLSLAVVIPAILGTSQLVTGYAQAQEAETRPLAVTDIMKFREIARQDWSENGLVYAYDAVPDLGDATGYIATLNENLSLDSQWHVERGTHPRVSSDGAYVVFTQRPTLLDQEQAESQAEKEALVTNQVLVNTETGEQVVFENAKSAGFTGDNLSLVMLQERNSEDGESKVQVLVFVNLETGTQREAENIASFAVAESGPRVVYQTKAEDEQMGQVRVRNTSNHTELTLLENTGKAAASFAFNEEGKSLAILAADADSEKDDAERGLYLWSFGERKASMVAYPKEGWAISQHSQIEWMRDDTALMVGARPVEAEIEELPKPETVEDLYSVERILEERRVQVWHGEDDRISTHQREGYSRQQRAVANSMYWLNEARWVHYSDDVLLNTWIDEEYQAGLQFDSGPYLQEITWNGFFQDLYYVNVETGERTLVAEKLPSWQGGSLSPDGQYVAYLQDGDLKVYSAQTNRSETIAADVNVSWVDEENDRPADAYGYGFGGWLEDSSAFLVNDRFDVWKFTPSGEGVNLTQGHGREHEHVYRVVEPEEGFWGSEDTVFVHGYDEKTKGSAFYSLDLQRQNLTELVAGEKTYRVVKPLIEENILYFTEENFRQFPDVQVANFSLSSPVTITDINPQQSEFVWGKAELVSWESTVGEDLEGILIKPDGYDPNRRYPVMVYYYEKFSQRLHQFNQMKVNHRPNFPFYLGQDYLVFLPDINFRVGAPGPSATESLVPAMEMLVEEGLADPDGLGLHGHSWSGYQTAFVVTETDIFDAAVAGAPVSNMTSAYSGIRWGSGLARQFQYEQGQSRLGVSMYEDIDPYIENSPVFFADQINTPMLIQFGDEDGAVPWEQGIEYYLALRRLNKPVVMLQYEGEPHHLQQYANKVDYTLKMLEFFDYHLKGEGSPEWWLEGVEYQDYD